MIFNCINKKCCERLFYYENQIRSRSDLDQIRSNQLGFKSVQTESNSDSNQIGSNIIQILIESDQTYLEPLVLLREKAGLRLADSKTNLERWSA